MEVGLTKIEEVSVLTIKGRIDASSASKLENTCNKLLAQKETKVLIDGTSIDFISSAGLRVLLKLAKEVKKYSGNLAVAHINDHVQQIFKISGFNELFPIYDNVVEGLNHLQKK